jgi:hypothetical protein
MWSYLSSPPGARSAFVRCLPVVLLALATMTVAHADIQQAKPRRNLPKGKEFRELPANAVPQAAQVDAGGEVEITLQARGQEGKSIAFLPRDLPAHGSLTNLHSLTRNTAAVTYVQNPGDDAASDQFTYSVQANGTLVSAPVTVDIEIIAPPPRVAVSPGELDFGAVNLGETSRARITLENRGGGLAVGQVQPPAPWVVEGSPEYRLAKNARQTFQLVFRPGIDRVFDDEIYLGRDADQHARLVGTGVGTGEEGKAIASTSSGRAIDPSALPAYSPPVLHIGEEAPSARNGAAAGSSTSRTASGAAEGAAGSSRPNLAPGEQFTNPAFATLNEAGVDRVQLRWRDSRSMKIAWKTPEPKPKNYRVELRYLSIESGGGDLQIDWRPYAKTEIQIDKGETVATLRGLPPGTRQTLRVVAVDSRGRFAAPSAMIQVEMLPGSNWWRITPLRVLCLALAVCLGLLWRRRQQEKEILQEIDDARALSMRS